MQELLSTQHAATSCLLIGTRQPARLPCEVLQLAQQVHPEATLAAVVQIAVEAFTDWTFNREFRSHTANP